MDNKPRRTPAEVAADASVEHTSKGVLNQMKGNVRSAWGNLTGSSKHQVGGAMDRMKGRAQETLGRLEGKEAELESGIGEDPDKI
jgi:uncharacterized protein YjbJ (UPF0337 family)